MEILVRKQFTAPLHLRLNNNKITGYGLHGIENHKLINLQSLSLSENYLGNQGIHYLRRAQLPSLQNLELYACKIGEQGALTLSKCLFPALRSLTLTQNKIPLSGHKNLSFSSWPRLQQLYLGQINPKLYCIFQDPITLFQYFISNYRSLEIQICIRSKRIKKDVFRCWVRRFVKDMDSEESLESVSDEGYREDN